MLQNNKNIELRKFASQMTIDDNYEHYCLFCGNYDPDKFRRNVGKTSSRNETRLKPTNLKIDRSHSNIKVCEKSLSKCSVQHPCDRKVSYSNIRKHSHHRQRNLTTKAYDDDNKEPSYDFQFNSRNTRLQAGHSPTKSNLKSDYEIHNTKDSNKVSSLTATPSYGRTPRLESSNCVFSKPYYDTSIPKHNIKYRPHEKISGKSSQSDKSSDEKYISKETDRKSSPTQAFFGDILSSPYFDGKISFVNRPSYDMGSNYDRDKNKQTDDASNQPYIECKQTHDESKQTFDESKQTFNARKPQYIECKQSYNDSKPSYESKPSYNESYQSYNDSKSSYNESKMSYNQSKKSCEESTQSYFTGESKIPSYISEDKSNENSKPSFESNVSAYTENKQRIDPTQINDIDSEVKPFFFETPLACYPNEDKTYNEIKIANEDRTSVEKTKHQNIKQEFQKDNMLKKSRTKQRKQTSFRRVTHSACIHGENCNCIICPDKHCTHMELTTTPDEAEIRRKIAEVCIQKKACSLHADNNCSVTSCPEAIRISESCRSYHDGFASSDIFQTNASCGEKYTKYFLRFCVLCALIKCFTWSWTAKEVTTSEAM